MDKSIQVLRKRGFIQNARKLIILAGNIIDTDLFFPIVVGWNLHLHHFTDGLQRHQRAIPSAFLNKYIVKELVQSKTTKV